MKTIILFNIFNFGFFIISFSQQYGWTDISANIPTEADLSDVFFVSDDEGWISVSSDAIILHTTDGGETFEVQTTQYPTEAIYMIDENEGYSGGANGRVYRTTDGGENWIAIGSIGVTLTDIDFATSTQGYCCGDNGQVHSITPQGVTNLNSGLASDLAGVCSPSINNVWICGGNNIVHFDGANWVFQTGPVGSYNAISFIDDNEGWVGGNSGILGHTDDAGNNWENQAPANPSDESLFDIIFLNAELGWAVGANGAIIKTSNGGDNWGIVGSGLTTSLLRGVHFTSPNNGYVVGNEETLMKYGEITNSVEEIETIQFEIFPNPAKNKIEIRCSEFKTESGIIEILSLDGKKILEKENESGNKNIELDLKNLKNGMYLCKISTDKKSSTKKLIIE